MPSKKRDDTLTPEYHAHLQAIASGKPIRHKPLPETLVQPGISLDLETRLDDGRVWCFGWQVRNEPFQVAIVDQYYEGDALNLPDGQSITFIEDSDQGWRMMADAAAQNAGYIYHWGSFEKGVLRKTAPDDVIEALLDRLHDLNRTFRQTCAMPIRGTGIKKVAPYLGLNWPEGTSALTAWSDYQKWLLNSDKEALMRAVAYNRVDVEAVTEIWRWMNDPT
jgi:predicted RecB family nuclease